jgi:hypothetical protein
MLLWSHPSVLWTSGLCLGLAAPGLHLHTAPSNPASQILNSDSPLLRWAWNSPFLPFSTCYGPLLWESLAKAGLASLTVCFLHSVAEQNIVFYNKARRFWTQIHPFSGGFGIHSFSKRFHLWLIESSCRLKFKPGWFGLFIFTGTGQS